MEKQAKTSKKPRTRRQQKLVAELANPQNKTIAAAGRKAGFSEASVRSTVYGLAKSPFISNEVQKRINRATAHHKVTPEEVVGSAAFQMRSSMRDVLDDEGSFDFEKACKTGAIDLLKKHEETIVTVEGDKFSTTTRKIKVEMLTNQDGRKEVANYIGVENFGDNKPPITDEEMFVVLFNRIVAKGKLTPEEAVRGLKRQEKFAHLDETKLLNV